MSNKEHVNKVRIEITDGEEEIVIKCKEITPEIMKLKEKLETNDLMQNHKMMLKLGEDEHIVDISNILFFESESNDVLAHTSARIYRTNLKLYGLEGLLPNSFMRISKATIVNLNRISWYNRELTGNGKAGFANSDKQVYVSRMYFKQFTENLKEMRGVIK